MNKRYSLKEHQAVVGELLNFQGTTLSSQFKADLASGNIKLLNNTSIFRKMISPSVGTQQLFDANTKKVVGVSDFSERVLAPSEVLIIEKIRIGYDTNDDAGKEAALTYGKILSTSFRNAVLRIRQNGDVKYEISLSDLQNKYTGDSLESDIVTLNIPVVLVGGADIKLELEFAEGAMPVALKKEYLEFAFKGQKVTR